jgi:hypothetical protein
MCNGALRRPPDKLRTAIRIYDGDELTEGSVNPHDLLRLKVSRVRRYISCRGTEVYGCRAWILTTSI